MRAIDEIISDMTRLVREAHELGMIEAETIVKAKVEAIFDRFPGSGYEAVVKQAIGPGHPRAERGDLVRAAPGTVKPVIVQMIVGSHDGYTMEELVDKTGFKPNSVRGTLSTLREEGKITKIGDKWHSAERLVTEPRQAPGAPDLR